MAGLSERDPQDPPRTTSGLADPTRDIRLPPLPGTAGPELPPEWESLRPARETASEAVSPPPEVEVRDTATPDPALPPPLADQPTDQLGQPTEGARDKTLTFSGTAAQRWAAGHPATPDPAWTSVPPEPGPVVVGPRARDARSRRWPWVVLTLVPILVIVVTGVWLLVLMRG
jgi:hypothetical protein